MGNMILSNHTLALQRRTERIWRVGPLRGAVSLKETWHFLWVVANAHATKAPFTDVWGGNFLMLYLGFPWKNYQRMQATSSQPLPVAFFLHKDINTEYIKEERLQYLKNLLPMRFRLNNWSPWFIAAEVGDKVQTDLSRREKAFKLT